MRFVLGERYPLETPQIFLFAGRSYNQFKWLQAKNPEEFALA